MLFILRNGASVSFIWMPQWTLVGRRERSGPGPLDRYLGMVCSPPWPGPQDAATGWAVVTSRFREQLRLWALFLHLRCPRRVCHTVEEEAETFYTEIITKQQKRKSLNSMCCRPEPWAWVLAEAPGSCWFVSLLFSPNQLLPGLYPQCSPCPRSGSWPSEAQAAGGQREVWVKPFPLIPCFQICEMGCEPG